jgi:hypothetical protein
VRITRILLALVFTLGLLYIARANSRGRPEQYDYSENGFQFTMISVPKITEHGSDTIRLSVDGPAESQYSVLYLSSEDKLALAGDITPGLATPMKLISPDSGIYAVEVTAGNRGGRSYYRFVVVDSTGNELAGFQDKDGESFFVKYIGIVPTWILVGHILFIFATVFFVAMTMIHAQPLIFGGQKDCYPMAVYAFWAVVLCFIGCYPFGFAMNWYAFNGLWEGVPFGTDATDNKTQLLFVYLLFLMLISFGSLTRGKIGRDLFGVRTLGRYGIGSLVVLLAIYLIPHSIQFSAGLTYAVCYSFIGLFALVYLIGLMMRSRRDQPVEIPR